MSCQPYVNIKDPTARPVFSYLQHWLGTKRTLGQLGNSKAAIPLLDQFDRLYNDDWGLPELPVVMGMLGEAVITPLATYLNETQHDEFARVMAVDGLAEIAKRQSACHDLIYVNYE